MFATSRTSATQHRPAPRLHLPIIDLCPPRALILCIALGLGGCGVLDEGLRDVKLRATATISDLIPTWMGGLPSSAPPRPDDPKYAQWLKAQQEEAARPKNDKKDDTPKPEPQSSEAPTN